MVALITALFIVETVRLVETVALINEALSLIRALRSFHSLDIMTVKPSNSFFDVVLGLRWSICMIKGIYKLGRRGPDSKYIVFSCKFPFTISFPFYN